MDTKKLLAPGSYTVSVLGFNTGKEGFRTFLSTTEKIVDHTDKCREKRFAFLKVSHDGQELTIDIGENIALITHRSLTREAWEALGAKDILPETVQLKVTQSGRMNVDLANLNPWILKARQSVRPQLPKVAMKK